MDSLLGVPLSILIPAATALFLGGVGALVATALRDRVLARLALRNIPRRRAQSVLICLGLALATVIVATALNTGDTMRFTVRTLVAGTLGRTDEVIVQPRRDARRTGLDGLQAVADGSFLTGSLTTFDQGEFERLAAELAGEERIVGLAPTLVDQVVALNLTTQELQAQVRIYGLPRDYPPVFGRLESHDGRPVSLAELEPGGLLMNIEAAAALQAWPGHQVRLFYRERQLDLSVGEVVKNGELGGVQPIIVLPLDELQARSDQARQINQILVANRGEAATSVLLSRDVAAIIRPLLVDDEAARRLHGALRTDVARAELASMLPTLDERTRERIEALLRELELDAPTERFKTIISDPELERRLFGVGARIAAMQGRPGTNLLSISSPLRVVEVKRVSQEIADRWGGALTNVFLFLGLFSIATGALLVVLIFALLAAERRPELGVFRALGGSRRQLLAMFLYEGVVYDLVAALIGVVVGVAVAVALIRASAVMLAGFGISISPHVEPASLWLAYCLGGTLTMLSIAYGAWRASRLTVVAAIRNLAEPPRADRSRRRALIGPALLLGGLALVAWGSGDRGALLNSSGDRGALLNSSGSQVPLAMAGGVALAVLGGVLGGRRLLGRLGLEPTVADRAAFSAGGVALVAYWLAPPEAFRWLGIRPLPRSMDLFVLAGLSLVLGATWLLAFNLEALTGFVRRAGDRWPSATVVVRASLAYPAAQRFRTALAIAMFSLVIFSMVVASVLLTGTHRAYSDPRAMAAGFDIRVEQTIGGAPSLLPLLAEVSGIKEGDLVAVATQRQAPTEAIQPGRESQMWRGIGLHLVDEPFLQTVTAGFTARAPGYASDADVWRALRDQPGLAVIGGPAVRPRGAETRGTTSFRIEGVAQEDTRLDPQTVWVRDLRGGRAVKLTVIGVVDPRASFGIGLFTSEASLAESGAPPPGRTTYLLKVADGVAAAEKALALNLQLGERGLRAAEIGEEVRRIQSLRMLLNELLQGFIGVGLLAGIAGLGVISMRVVVERRQQIGVLRALGFTRRAVQATFLLESSLVAVLGIACGVVLGLGLSYRLVEFLGREFPEIVFAVPAGQIASIAAATYAAALALTFAPAYLAGRVNPAEALRLE